MSVPRRRQLGALFFSFTRLKASCGDALLWRQCWKRGGRDEKTYYDDARRCDPFNRAAFGDVVCVRARRLRAEPASQRVGILRLRGTKSGLVPESEGPSGHAHAERHASLPVSLGQDVTPSGVAAVASGVWEQVANRRRSQPSKKQARLTPGF